MENANDLSVRKTGEMFTASILKKVTPVYQSLFALAVALVLTALAHFAFQSTEGTIYAACFGVVFYVMFNPWLCLLADTIKPYFLQSIALYAALSIFLFGLVYLLTGLSPINTFEIKLILMTTTFYNLVAYAMMSALKLLFIDPSGGGL
ncbi:MAG: hypothetical protein U0T84_02730 [Chitinophagales bacterium]